MAEPRSTPRLVDVHAHLHIGVFDEDRAAVIQRAEESGLGVILENGLDPESNRQVLRLSQQISIVKPALGIHPLNAVAHQLQTWDAAFRPSPFDIAAELAFIESQGKNLLAIGETGLDGHWAPKTASGQKEVFAELIRISHRLDLPIVVHSRKLERDCVEILEQEGAKRVCLHSFGGKLRLARRAAENGWYLSIPPLIARSTSFQSIVKKVPHTQILTETDCPYQGPRKGQRNEPAFILDAVAQIAEIWRVHPDEATEQIWRNFTRLFGPALSST